MRHASRWHGECLPLPLSRAREKEKVEDKGKGVFTPKSEVPQATKAVQGWGKVLSQRYRQ